MGKIIASVFVASAAGFCRQVLHSVAIGLLLLLATSPANAQQVKLKKVDMVAAFPKLQVYAIEAGESSVSGSLIKRVELGKNSAIITYFNKSKTFVKPDYHFRVINNYGMEISRFWDNWLLDSIGGGETHKEEKTFVRHAIDKIFEFTTIDLPKDWETPSYLVIEGAQP